MAVRTAGQKFLKPAHLPETSPAATQSKGFGGPPPGVCASVVGWMRAAGASARRVVAARALRAVVLRAVDVAVTQVPVAWVDATQPTLCEAAPALVDHARIHVGLQSRTLSTVLSAVASLLAGASCSVVLTLAGGAASTSSTLLDQRRTATGGAHALGHGHLAVVLAQCAGSGHDKGRRPERVALARRPG